MKFFKIFLATLLAFVVGSLLSMIIFISIIASFASLSSHSIVSVEKDSILEIDLSTVIKDQPETDPFAEINLMKMKTTPSITILNAVRAIETAAHDDKIKGIYLTMNGISSIGLANAEEIRAAITKFKESGKFVLAYSTVYTQGAYYLASVADKVYIHPEGGVQWTGLSANVMFLKGLLAKLDIEPIVLRHGTFKSAVEPFIEEKMTAANRLQQSMLINSIWGVMLSDISSSRGIDSLELNKFASELTITTPEVAVEKGFFDSILYSDQVKQILCELTYADSEKDLKKVSLTDYASYLKTNVKSISNNKIAIIYAVGDIVDGDSERGMMGGNTVAEQLAKVRRDDKVKAVVLRVNSPGGSALASDVVWREMMLLKSEKPVVVSMGTYAASGGYYVSCPADVILADRTTVTGSIGVFGLFFNAQSALKNKLGVTVDVVKTNPYADLGSMFHSASKAEKDYFMVYINKVYNTFVNHVGEGRNMTFEQVDNIGGGRVWSGVDAKQIGLVDGFGGIVDAINLAADRAGVADDYRVSEIKVDGGFAAMLKQFSSAKVSLLESELGSLYNDYKEIQSLVSSQGVQARMPYIMDIN